MVLEDKLDNDIIEPFKEHSEMSQVMENMDRDEVDTQSQMSSVDMNARLTNIEIPAILIIDELQRMGIFPSGASITRQKKRLSISIEGKGREEKVQMIQGERSHKSGGGFGGFVQKMFTKKEE